MGCMPYGRDNAGLRSPWQPCTAGGGGKAALAGGKIGGKTPLGTNAWGGLTVCQTYGTLYAAGRAGTHNRP